MTEKEQREAHETPNTCPHYIYGAVDGVGKGPGCSATPLYIAVKL
eukprot:gene842-479_t